jgi:hypothetical protein
VETVSAIPETGGSVAGSMRVMRSTDTDAFGAYGASARARSPTVAKRRATSFSRHRMITVARPGGKSGRRESRGTGSSFITRDATSITLSPVNGTWPAHASYRMMPSAQMSVRESTLREERSCSGDEYKGDPMNDVVFVRAWSEPSRDLEIPKSSTLTSGEPSALCATKRFAGFKSRWTIPSECASATASHA